MFFNKLVYAQHKPVRWTVYAHLLTDTNENVGDTPYADNNLVRSLKVYAVWFRGAIEGTEKGKALTRATEEAAMKRSQEAARKAVESTGT